MYYTSEQLLSTSNSILHINAFIVYLNVFLKNKKAFDKLKPHEKHFLFSWLETITYRGNLLDLYKLPEAHEYLFYNIIVIYKKGVIELLNGSNNGSPIGMPKEKRIIVEFYKTYYHQWVKQVNSNKGWYFPILTKEIKRKLEETKGLKLNPVKFTNRATIYYSCFFFIYYKAKLFFEEQGTDHFIFELGGYRFVANVFTFCHILSRHYIPTMNEELDVSFNGTALFDDCNNIIPSIKNLLVSYFEKTSKFNMKKNNGYILFKNKDDKYIMRIKCRKMSCLSNGIGYEIRTFFKCEKDAELSLFSNTTDISLNNNWICCIDS